MRMFQFALIGLLLTISMHAWGDTLFLKNGSSIDGIMVGKKEGMVLLQIGNLGRMEIPEKEIKHIEKNTRTGYVDPGRGKRTKRDVLVDDTDEPREGDDGPAPVEEEKPEVELTVEQRKQARQWVYDLTRNKPAFRVRAERKLIALGSPVIKLVLPIAQHPSELTRLAAFRILKKVAKKGDVKVIEAAMLALEDEERFVRKLAWESLKKASGRRYRFPWDHDTTEAERARALKRWNQWWNKEKVRLEAEDKARRRAELLGEDD